ncbi:MogA/MoaB family molybdenum cofactor biosynthesis protein [Candidatus Bathyarchaeota archaeon]|nr:MogA/MoaB family molybdenum cofactor biosynthesis protein [Candidatus Bathyarchaeota archaeon]
MSESTKKHKSAAPKQLNFAVFVCSTSRYQEAQKSEKIDDVSGDTIEALLRNAGHRVLSRKIIADDKGMIEEAVHSVLSSAELDSAVFCGGTGVAPKDVTIETVSPFFEKTLPGFGEIFRRLSYDKMGSAAVMSRAVAGVAKGKVLFCIPGSADAVRVSVETLILPETPHIVRHVRE